MKLIFCYMSIILQLKKYVYDLISFDVYMRVCIYIYIHAHETITTIKVINIPIIPKSFLLPLCSLFLLPLPSPFPFSQATTDLCSVTID